MADDESEDEDCTHDQLRRYTNVTGSEHVYWCFDCGQSFTVTLEEDGG